MEAGALKPPPRMLEQLVLLLTPPAARELVAGDLWEIYLSPSQYLLEAIRILPFVIASQARRNANLPLLGLQTFLAFFFFSGAADGERLHWAQTAVPVTVVVLILLLLDAYRGTKPPSVRYAILETILAVYGAFLFSNDMTFGPQALPLLVGLAPLAVPVLCIFRVGVMLENDRRRKFLAGKIAMEEIVEDYRRFVRRTGWRNRIEAYALGAASLAFAYFGLRDVPAYASLGYGLVSVDIAAALYLLLNGAPQPVPAGENSLSLVALFQQELAQQDQLRRFLWWLWVSPLMFEIYITLIQHGHAVAKRDSVAFGFVVTILLGFVIGAINRDRSGRVQETIGNLAQMSRSD